MSRLGQFRDWATEEVTSPWSGHGDVSFEEAPDPYEKNWGFIITDSELGNWGVTVPLGDGTPMAVGQHFYSPNLQIPFQAGCKHIVVSSRIAAVDDSLFQSRIAAALKRVPLDGTAEITLRLLSGTYGSQTQGEFQRNILVWAAAERMNTVAGAPNSIARGKALSSSELQQLLEMDGYPTSHSDHYTTSNRLEWRHAFWTLVFKDKHLGSPMEMTQRIRSLLNRAVDITFHLLKLPNTPWLWVWALVHAQTRGDSFESLENALASYCEVKRVQGKRNLQLAYQACLPGSSVFPNTPHFHVRDEEIGAFLGEIALNVDGPIRRGVMPVGHSILSERQSNIFADWAGLDNKGTERRSASVLVTGVPDAGKTIQVLKMLLAELFVFVHLSEPKEKVVANYVANAVGRTFIPLELPNPASKAELATESKLIKAKVAEVVERWVKQWEEDGIEEYLPIVIQLKTGHMSLYHLWVGHLLDLLLPALNVYLTEKGGFVAIVLDDATAGMTDVNDPTFGELVPEAWSFLVSAALRALNTARKQVSGLAVTAQTLSSLIKGWGLGLVQSFALGIALSQEVNHQCGLLFDPSSIGVDTVFNIAALYQALQRGEPVILPPAGRGLFNPYMTEDILGRIEGKM